MHTYCVDDPLCCVNSQRCCFDRRRGPRETAGISPTNMSDTVCIHYIVLPKISMYKLLSDQILERRGDYRIFTLYFVANLLVILIFKNVIVCHLFDSFFSALCPMTLEIIFSPLKKNCTSGRERVVTGESWFPSYFYNNWNTPYVPIKLIYFSNRTVSYK